MMTIHDAAIKLNKQCCESDKPFTAIGIANNTLILYTPTPAKYNITEFEEYSVKIIKMDTPEPAQIEQTQ